MAQLTLVSVQMTPPFRITIIAPNGARLGYEWANKEDLKLWMREVEDDVDPDVILKRTIKKLHAADSSLSQLPGLVGKTFEFTPSTVEVLP